LINYSFLFKLISGKYRYPEFDMESFITIIMV